MRGKVQLWFSRAVTTRITPAHAGKSPRPARSRPRGWDHPRACGEKSFQNTLPSPSLGSPPRMRGKAPLHSSHFGLHGITPAHAGKSAHRVHLTAIHGDHPRACGEKDHIISVRSFFQGSPPRMRGKVLVTVYQNVADGITPAHAGKSMASRSSRLAAWDHPRACGEKQVIMWLHIIRKGSPPRMRGKVIRTIPL